MFSCRNLQINIYEHVYNSICPCSHIRLLTQWTAPLFIRNRYLILFGWAFSVSTLPFAESIITSAPQQTVIVVVTRTQQKKYTNIQIRCGCVDIDDNTLIHWRWWSQCSDDSRIKICRFLRTGNGLATRWHLISALVILNHRVIICFSIHWRSTITLTLFGPHSSAHFHSGYQQAPCTHNTGPMCGGMVDWTLIASELFILHRSYSFDFILNSLVNKNLFRKKIELTNSHKMKLWICKMAEKQVFV